MKKKGVNYNDIEVHLKDFLKNFEDPKMVETSDPNYSMYGRHKYLHILVKFY